ncbi:neuronal acetylcholine receptor subunit alpha-7-like [Syngnathus acus]|uniref:neuronal acetylcholine receptor subunit alpha-7-like n=1 Tax=Syngnathus acus TaxID=161584 RepID=UPI00188612AC|nr:neuronal acetylcholine receptor subunit alpha-7-like [Syngnathus acus]
MAPYDVLLLLLVSFCTVQVSIQGENEHRLVAELMQNNWGERPVINESQVLNVKVGIYLTQIIELDETSQVLTTNIWLTLSWNDYQLQWDPSQYNELDTLHLQNDVLWKPDIVLYNSAQERFETTFDAKVVVTSSGNCNYIPQAIFRSTCHVDLRWFPFDTQKCDLKFGSWTYGARSLDLTMSEAVISEYVPNGEWELVEVSGKKNSRIYECCEEPYSDVTYTIVMRRRTLFYVVHLLIPSILISILALFVFLLPADSGEKITLGVAVMLSLILLMTLGANVIPANSDSVPLIAQYFIITIVIVTLSVIVTVVVLQFHHHDPHGAKMPKWIRVVLFDWCAWFLRMKRPGEDSADFNDRMVQPASPDSELVGRAGEGEVLLTKVPSPTVHSHEPEIAKILDEVRYIAKRFREQQQGKTTCSDWKFAAVVIDRLCFVIFLLFIVLFTLGIFVSAPN